MNDTSERTEDAADLECRRQAIACRSRLEGGRLPDPRKAQLYCRLGESLYYRKDCAAAVEYARAALELQPKDECVADFCAWLFSNCGHYGEAADAYERLLESHPLWAAGHRHASGAFAADGQMDRAIFHGLRACELDPGAFEPAFHSGCLLESAGRYQDAADLFARAARIDPANAAAWRRLSALAAAQDRPAQAVDLALRAFGLEPANPDNALHAAELLLRAMRHDEAAAILRSTVTIHPTENVAWRLLSAAEMLRSGLGEALDAINRALVLAPGVVEYHLHRGNLLYRLGELDAAAAAFGRAASLDPANLDARRSQLTAYFDER